MCVLGLSFKFWDQIWDFGLLFELWAKVSFFEVKFQIQAFFEKEKKISFRT